MILQQRIRPFRPYFLLLIALLLLTSPLAASGSAILDMSGTAPPVVGDSPAADCSVPGDFSTIQEAVGDAGCTTITVGIGLFHENVTINRPLAITGQGAADTAVDGGGSGSVITIQSGTEVILTGLTITNGGGSPTVYGISGGGIYNEGNLIVNYSIVSNNSTYYGGGIFNEGNLTVNNSIVIGNSANVLGGGIFNIGEANLIIDNSTISNNSAHNGGGIRNGASLTISNSTISNNSADKLDGGIGGGIYHSHEASLIIDNSTISNNYAYNGGGICNGGNLTIDNSTISNNSAASRGGGIYNIGFGAELIISNNTISENSAAVGGGILNDSGSVILRNSIVANSKTSDDCTAYYSGFNSQGFNLDSDNTCNLIATGDLPNTDPRLGPLQDNGGDTFTHALLSASPAIDSGNCPDANSDQRGYARPVDIPDTPNVADGCDIGAFEFHSVNDHYLPFVTRP